MSTAGGPAVLLVRHAETEWSLAGKHTGRADIPLTDRGRDAARALAPSLAGRRFSLVLSSPLGRATETAALAGLEPELDDDLLEWDYGAYEGRTALDVREERPGWVLWRDGVPDGESPADVAARADRVIARILQAGGDEVCVVAHGHLLRMLTGRWLEQDPSFGQRLPLAAGHLAVLGWERGARVLRGWNLPAPP